MTTPPVNVKVISDVVCPWCYVGMKNLFSAWEQLGFDAIDIQFSPYQLDETIPAAGLDRETYMVQKFGSLERIQAAHDRLLEAGKAADIDFNFNAIKMSPNTLNAHRLIYLAGTHGQEAQIRVVARLFRAYFEEGKDIGDRDVLVLLGAEAGLSTEHVIEMFESDTYRKEVLTEIESTKRMGVTGVPCFVFEGRYVLSGAQPPEVLRDAITEISTAKARGELDTN